MLSTGSISSRLRHAADRPCLFITGVALLLRLGYCAWTHLHPYPFADRYREYVIIAKGLIEHGAFLSPIMPNSPHPDVSALMPPAYSIWLAGLYGLFGVESTVSIVIMEIANALALSLACGVAYKIGEQLGGRNSAWVAGGIAALNPVLIIYVNYPWDTSFFVLSVAISLWISISLARVPIRLAAYLGFGAWLGIVALLNPALTLAYPLLILFPLCRVRPWLTLNAIKGVAVAIVGWAVVLTPWTLRNHQQLGSWIYVRSGLLHEIWMGVAPEADRDSGTVFQQNFPLNNPEVARHVEEIGEARFIEERAAMAREAIAASPVRYVRLCARRAVDYWFGTVLTHARPGAKIIPQARSRRMIMAVLAIEALLVLYGLIARRQKLPGFWLVAGIIFIFSVTYCATHVQVRFRTPIEPLMAVAIGVVFWGISQTPTRSNT